MLSNEITLPKTNEVIPFSTYDAGKLLHGNSNSESPDFNNIADFYIGGGFVEIRIPWLLLNVMDPSTKQVIGDFGDLPYFEEEAIDGTNPLSRFSCRTGCFSFDVDENLEAQPLTDGLLVIRHLFGFSGDSLTSGAVSGGASRDSSDTIASYLTDADSQLDIDGDGESKPLTDGLLLIRYLFGFSGDSLVSGAIGSGATRDTAETVEAYIKERIPAE